MGLNPREPVLFLLVENQFAVFHRVLIGFQDCIPRYSPILIKSIVDPRFAFSLPPSQRGWENFGVKVCRKPLVIATTRSHGPPSLRERMNPEI